MATHYSDISAALDGRLDALGELVAWENRHFEAPTDDTLFLRQTNLAGDTVQAELGTNGQDFSIGIYQVDIIGTFGKGKAPLYALSDAVCDHFARGQVMTYNGIKVRVRGNKRGAMVTDEQQAMIPVEIFYEAYTAAR